uniref:Uncharacterized protein n=1 Tax=Chlamydomonas leiostraca TaxID=1034604 RepID=A0A7S0RD99_9CHLO|mmetsp:Transcript_19629/g.49880  ORF Transcript_19629/g.49880 Transcript_19629/m.49880 type:complete len:168 (+) Transcript_19629:56-559(+)|eukprot:CAMPEP_0202857196 /NCGR_PEP_ID=MMETSP1391-20130828/234_1 /ASSEMBLY_ACC=CAM_ASM_000867 /TAXON_ID=1034604 /ORGANISM="Chlamydomonas leiostraca, Strain SAG 11-49" /LENGTH=167 /DNA_ID=CAMNT_0049535971 /DNA_START=56 /DNA_END=559 /DNA_ORIENTATION=+
MSALALPLVGLTFCTWAVYLGGLASLQDDCSTEQVESLDSVWGLSALPCSKVFRFHWFIMSWEVVVVAMLAVAAVTGKLASMRTSFVGLFAISTLLYIEASNTFLTAQSATVTGQYFQEGQPEHRLRTITAGAIMTALMNAIIVTVIGMNEEAAAPAKAEDVKAAAV